MKEDIGGDFRQDLVLFDHTACRVSEYYSSVQPMCSAVLYSSEGTNKLPPSHKN